MITLAIDSERAEKLENPVVMCTMAGSDENIISDFVYALSYAYGVLYENDSKIANFFKNSLIEILKDRPESPVWSNRLYKAIADEAQVNGSTLINSVVSVDKKELKKQMQELLNNESE